MTKLSSPPTGCKCGQLTPLRKARVDALVQYFGEGGGATVAHFLYLDLRARFGWTRGVADQVLNDAVTLGSARFVKNDWGFEIEVIGGEDDQCHAA